MSHNCVISNQVTPWSKKIDSQTTICKIFSSCKLVCIMCFAGQPSDQFACFFCMPSPKIPEGFFGRHKSSHCKPGLRLRTSSEIFMLFVILADNTIFTIK